MHSPIYHSRAISFINTPTGRSIPSSSPGTRGACYTPSIIPLKSLGLAGQSHSQSVWPASLMSVRKSELNQYDANAYPASIEPLFLHLWIFEASLQEDYNWPEFVRPTSGLFLPIRWPLKIEISNYNYFSFGQVHTLMS